MAISFLTKRSGTQFYHDYQCGRSSTFYTKFPGGPYKFKEISRISRSCRHPVGPQFAMPLVFCHSKNVYQKLVQVILYKKLARVSVNLVQLFPGTRWCSSFHSHTISTHALTISYRMNISNQNMSIFHIR